MLQRANVIHQCGPANIMALRARAVGLPADLVGRYHLTDFVGPELPDVLAFADVVVSRSGAGTLAELTALGKPAVFVPLESAVGNEQAHNARHPQESGAAVCLEGDVTAEQVRNAMGPLLADAHLRQAMVERARMYGRPDAADRLVDQVVAAAVGQPVTVAGRCGEPSQPR